MSRLLPAVVLMIGFLFAGEALPDWIVPGQVIFKLAPQTTLLKARSTATGVGEVDRVLSKYHLESVEPMFPATVTRRGDLPDISRIYSAKFDKEISPFRVAEELQKLPQVVYAEPQYIRQIKEKPNDPRFNDQWYLSKIVASDAWDISHGDSTVVVAVIDNGCDMDHPDLETNYFTNPNEIPGNGVDDDRNGFVDDIHGWDFAGDDSDKGPHPDNDPDHGPEDAQGYWIHGTHVAGIANAVTDNSEGIAGIAWNVKTLPIKATYDNSPQSIFYGYKGVVYAAQLGADVINCSWGGGGYSKAEAEMIEYAIGYGSLIVAAAGNENTGELHYPSAYEGVLSVASIGSTDGKSSFSNFGLSVDVSAPGEEILSTVPNGEYGHSGGTSMSSPVVAGLAALVKSHYPDLTFRDVASRVAGTVDDLDAANPGYAGDLGTGRVNALNALNDSISEFVTFPPEITLVTAQLTDSLGGDGNGVLDRRETVHVTTEYRNYSLGFVEDYSVRLVTDDPNLTVVIGETTHGLFPPDTTELRVNELSFSVSDTAAPGLVKLVLQAVTNGNLEASDTLTVTVGKMPILIVDDDFESCCGDVHVDGFYTGILDENDILYGVWDHSQQGSPSGEALSNFPVVIWFTEWDFPSLDSLDRAALRSYLDNGGNLYLSGQDLGWDLNENPGSTDQKLFFRDYLHATWGGDDAESALVEGILGDPIGHGLSFNVWQPGLEADNQYPDWFTPKNGAVMIFRYDDGRGMGLRYDGDYRLVYTGVGLEAFGSDINSTAPDNINDTQRTVLKRILSYLNFIHHEPFTDMESTDTDFHVVARITGDISDPPTVTLYYKAGTMDDFLATSMKDEGGGYFSGTIPAPNNPMIINYYVEMENSYYRWTNPVGVPDNVFQFYAGPDTVVPVFHFVSDLGDQVDRSRSAEVSAFVTDNIGIREVVLKYLISSDAGGTVRSAPMTFDGTLWRGDLTWADVPYRTTIRYWVTAVDSSSNPNYSVSDSLSFDIVKMIRLTAWEEQDLLGWDTGDGWGSVFISNAKGYGVEDSPGVPYENNANNILKKLDPVHISPHNTAYLTYWNRSFLHDGEDFGYVDLSSDGSNWETVSTITGQNIKRTDVIDVIGYVDGDVYIRFRMTSDDQNTSTGWFVDDIYLLVDTTLNVAVANPPEILPSKFSLMQNYPNPFNPITTIWYDLPRAGKVELVIYDILGREVSRPVNRWQEAGRHTLVWDAAGVSSGIYFYRLRAGTYYAIRKLAVLK